MDFSTGHKDKVIAAACKYISCDLEVFIQGCAALAELSDADDHAHWWN